MIRFKAPRWGHEHLAQRLCHILYGDDGVWRDHAGRWHLGSANDWWLHPQKDETFLLHHRYGRKARLRQLAAVLAWLLDVEIIEVA